MGNILEWDDIIKLCKKYNIKIIEDAAESLGAKYKIKAGKFGIISVFSLMQQNLQCQTRWMFMYW